MSINQMKSQIKGLEADIAKLKTDNAAKKKAAESSAASAMNGIENELGNAAKQADQVLQKKIEVLKAAQEAYAKAATEEKDARKDLSVKLKAYEGAKKNQGKTAASEQKALDKELSSALKMKEKEIKSLNKQISAQEKADAKAQAAQ